MSTITNRASNLQRRREANHMGDEVDSINTNGELDPSNSNSPMASASQEDDEAKPKHNLTLMEEILLLGLKDQQVKGCIIMELALRNRIRVIKESRRRALSDRYIEVVDSSNTGEVLLDEALRLIKNEKQSIANWIDLLSGETWNPMKVGYQLRQVRERLAKGLVDKGILRTEKHNFLFFDMATHPITDITVKAEIIARLVDALTGKGATPSLRSIVLIVAATAANLLPKILSSFPFDVRDKITIKAEELVREFAVCSNDRLPPRCNNEIVAGVLNIFTKMDNLLY